MCGHSLSLQDFNSNKMQRNTMFLNTTTSAVQYPPTLSAFRIHEVIVLLAEKSAADLSRYRKTRCAAARWYIFEDKGDYIDIYGGFYTCVSMGMSASIHLGGGPYRCRNRYRYRYANRYRCRHKDRYEIQIQKIEYRI